MLLAFALAAAAAAPVTRFAETSYGPMAYRDTGGEGPVVFLVHGLPTSKELWDPVLPLLDEGLRVVAMDLNNFGESGRTAQPLDHVQRARALDELRAGLGVQTFALVAHDLGASVAVDYMGAFGQHVERLVLMSSPVYPDFEEPGVVELVRREVPGLALLNLAPGLLMDLTLRRGMHHPERVPEGYTRRFLSHYAGREGKRALWNNLWWGTPETHFAAYPEILRAVTVPTLIVHGEADPFIPQAHAERMAADIQHSQLVLLRGGGHFLPMDTPEEIAIVLNAFLT